MGYAEGLEAVVPALTNEQIVELREALVRAVRQVCPAPLSDQADDIVQLATLKVIRILERSEGERTLGPSYLKKVAYTVAIDELRKRRVDREIAMDADLERTWADGAPDPERLARSTRSQAAIAECMDGLNDDRRAAVAAYLQGHSVPETGRLAGWSTKRAENLVYRGLAQLRECLRGKGVTP